MGNVARPVMPGTLDRGHGVSLINFLSSVMVVRLMQFKDDYEM